MSNVVSMPDVSKRRKRVLSNRMHVQIDDEQLQILDAEAERLGFTRAQMVRYLVMNHARQQENRKTA